MSAEKVLVYGAWGVARGGTGGQTCSVCKGSQHFRSCLGHRLPILFTAVVALLPDTKVGWQYMFAKSRLEELFGCNELDGKRLSGDQWGQPAGFGVMTMSRAEKLLSRQQAKRRREGWRQAGHRGDPAGTQVIRVNSELRMEGKQDILRQKKLDCNLSKRQEKGCRQGDRHELILVVEFSDCY